MLGISLGLEAAGRATRLQVRFQPKVSLVQNRNGAPRLERGNSIALEHLIIGGKEGK